MNTTYPGSDLEGDAREGADLQTAEDASSSPASFTLLSVANAI